MFKNVLIHYFSGTGNTGHIVKIIEKRLEENKINVDIINVENNALFSLDDYDLHIIVFPVYGFGMPKMMLQHIKTFNDVDSLKAAVISVGGCSINTKGEQGQALTHASKILNKRGFEVFYTKLVSYPNNFTQIFNPPSENDQEIIISKSDEEIIEITDKIINEEIYIKKRYILIYLLYRLIYILYTTIGRRVLGKIYIADNSCNSCGKCVKYCPVNNIKLVKGKPWWNWNCEGCQRCINICPKKSVQTSILRFILLLLVEILPIYLLVLLNKVYVFHFLINILLYLVSMIVFSVLVDLLIFLLELNKYTRKIFLINYTKRYRRYIVKNVKLK